MTSQGLFSRIAAAVFAIFVLPNVIWAQESIQAAQTLYASASYDEALALLDRLQGQQLPPADVQSLQQSRALCLLALGRSRDADCVDRCPPSSRRRSARPLSARPWSPDRSSASMH